MQKAGNLATLSGAFNGKLWNPSIPLEIGNITHEIIQGVLKRFLKSTEPIDREKFELYTKKIFFQV